jgi:hypothetical protein
MVGVRPHGYSKSAKTLLHHQLFEDREEMKAAGKVEG